MTTKQHSMIPRPSNESRLHLYLAWGCPFCHRVLAALELTGLKEHVSRTWVRNIKGANGWEISADDDPLFGELNINGVYQHLEPDIEHVPSVPLLVDLSSKTLLSNSSSQMTRFFSQGMNGGYTVKRNLCPVDLIVAIDGTNAWLNANISRAVYQVGFAHEQSDYEAKVMKLFQSLDKLETCLSASPYLLGDMLTESDLYLLATLVRFDSVYYPLFRCSVRRITDYVALSEYLERMQSIPGIAATYDHALIREHYFCSTMHVYGEIRDLNPSRLIPMDLYVYYQATMEITGEK
jgi:putative glutathione S-transferase